MKHRFQVLDIFRGAFALLVVLYHMRDYTQSASLQNPLVQNSFLFVDFFFVLSGFVIAYNYQAKIVNGATFNDFFKRRVKRLYPLHIIMLLVFVLYEFLKMFAKKGLAVDVNATHNTVYNFFTSLFLLNSVKFPHINGVSWNSPSWSISAEMLSYILFGLSMLLLSRFKLDRVRIFLYSLIIAASYFLIVNITGDYNIFRSSDYGFLRGFVGFFTGVISFNIFTFAYDKLKNVKPVVFSTLEVLLISFIFFLVFNANTFINYGFIYEAVFLLGILCYAFEKGIVSGALKRSAFLNKIGQYSFSIYMTHAIVNRLVNIVFIHLLKLSPNSYSYLWAIDLCCVVLVAGWSYKNIEMRFYKGSKPKERKQLITVTADEQAPAHEQPDQLLPKAELAVH